MGWPSLRGFRRLGTRAVGSEGFQTPRVQHGILKIQIYRSKQHRAHASKIAKRGAAGQVSD